MAVNDIFEAKMGWTAAGLNLVNIVHWRQNVYDGSSSRAALCVAMLGEIETEVIADWKPIGSDQVTLDTLEAFVLQEPTAFGVEPVAVTGDVTTDLIPVRSAPVATKTTLFRGRSYRGRMFLPPLTETQQDAGGIVAATRTSLDTWLNNMRNLNDGAGNTWKMCVYSPTLSTLPGGPFVSNDVSVVTTNLVMGSIRKRQKVN